MKPLALRTSLTLFYAGMLALLVTGLAFSYRFMLVRQLNADATASVEEKARGIRGYLQFKDGVPTLVYDHSDGEQAAFIDDATDYYQVYDARDGRLLAQSPGFEALGLHYTPDEVAAFRSNPSTVDVQTDRGTLRLSSSVISPATSEMYVVQVGELLDSLDRSLAAFDHFLVWRILDGILIAAVVGRWLAGRALAPLSRLAAATAGIGVANLSDRLPLRGAGDELDHVTSAFNDALERVEHSVGDMRQFSAALAHELRTPMAILRGQAEMALKQSKPEQLREVLIAQIEEFDRLTALVNHILTLARAEGGEIAMADEAVDLAELASSVVEQIEPVAAANDVTLTCSADDGITVRGDAGWLERLLLILLDNAIKFTRGGGQVSVSVDRSRDRVRLAVTDTGIGIAADAVPHVFERFYKADSARARQSDGVGLGLALARWIAEQHHATIDVRSRVDAGSTFTVTLPGPGAISLAQPNRRAPVASSPSRSVA